MQKSHKASARERATALLAEMTMEEKVAQLCAIWVAIEADGSMLPRGAIFGDGNKGAVSRESYAFIKHGIGQITRPLGTRPISAKDALHGLNLVQKFLKEQTRLGIPAIAHEECLAGLMAEGATAFPAAINYGSLWDADLMRKIGRAIGKELFMVGSQQGLAPVLDVSRDVRWGRTEETLGEDPYLCGSLATAWIQGLQSSGDSAKAENGRAILATLKHFAAHSFAEGARNHAPVRIGDRELCETFLLPFEMAVNLANPGSLMPAYHDIDGQPASSDVRLMKEILRDRWGFDGIIVSDYEAVRLLATEHNVAKDNAEAASLAIKAGMDIELPADTCYATGIIDALKRGLLELADVDAAVLRILREKFRLGLFENPYTDVAELELQSAEVVSVAREAAEKSIVLLQNDGVLPLKPARSTALIGPLADEPLAFYSGYSFAVHLISAARMVDTPAPKVPTLRQVLAADARSGELLYSRGCDILSGRPTVAPAFPGDLGPDYVVPPDPVSRDERLIDAAVATAKKAERIVVAVGDLSGLFLGGTVGEGSDTSSLELPGVQGRLIERLLELGKPLVVVLSSGRPYAIPRHEKISAIVQAWLPGQEGANAISRVLYGDVNPGGRLPVSFPKSAGAMPYFYNHKLKSSGSPIQREFGAIFPFGHGLGYTTFELSEFEIPAKKVPMDGEVSFSVDVRNSGARAGDTVVQCYFHDVAARFVRPVLELKAFTRVWLAPGETKRLKFHVPTDMLSLAIDVAQRVVEPGDFELSLGFSSQDIRHKRTITLEGKERLLPVHWRMESRVEQA